VKHCLLLPFLAPAQMGGQRRQKVCSFQTEFAEANIGRNYSLQNELSLDNGGQRCRIAPGRSVILSGQQLAANQLVLGAVPGNDRTRSRTSSVGSAEQLGLDRVCSFLGATLATEFFPEQLALSLIPRRQHWQPINWS
jgi:hypothetical protein